MTKGQERLFHLTVDINTAKDKIKDIEKELEALEIIINHKLLNYVLKNPECASMYHLNNKEIKLLKQLVERSNHATH